jgi:hypothetical protein
MQRDRSPIEERKDIEPLRKQQQAKKEENPASAWVD